MGLCLAASLYLVSEYRVPSLKVKMSEKFETKDKDE